MKYIFLVNQFSLKKKTDKVINKLQRVSDELKLDYVIEKNSNDRTTEEILKKYEKGQNIIMAIGGDGTINRVLNKIVGTKNILGYLPFGTGNDFYRTNKTDLTKGINKIDLIKINDRYFINVACFGIDADIGNSEVFVHSKIIPKSQRYNASALYHFFKYKPREIEIQLNDQNEKNLFTSIIVCNGKYYGGGYHIAPNSSLTDGLLDVYLVYKQKKLETAKLVIKAKKGKHESLSSVEKVQTERLILKSKQAIASNIDGEILKAKKFDISVIPKGIDVYYDQELIDKFTNK